MAHEVLQQIHQVAHTIATDLEARHHTPGPLYARMKRDEIADATTPLSQVDAQQSYLAGLTLRYTTQEGIRRIVKIDSKTIAGVDTDEVTGQETAYVVGNESMRSARNRAPILDHPRALDASETYTQEHMPKLLAELSTLAAAL